MTHDAECEREFRKFVWVSGEGRSSYIISQLCRSSASVAAVVTDEERLFKDDGFDFVGGNFAPRLLRFSTSQSHSSLG